MLAEVSEDQWIVFVPQKERLVGRGDYRPVRLRAAGHIRVVLSRLGALTVLALSLALRLCLQLLLLLSP